MSFQIFPYRQIFIDWLMIRLTAILIRNYLIKELTAISIITIMVIYFAPIHWPNFVIFHLQSLFYSCSVDWNSYFHDYSHFSVLILLTLIPVFFIAVNSSCELGWLRSGFSLSQSNFSRHIHSQQINSTNLWICTSHPFITDS